MQASTSMRGTSLRGSPFQAKPVRVSRVGRVGAVTVEANKKVLKKTKVILTTDVDGVGMTGEIKVVPVGYWRNYLLPNARAEIASSTVLETIRKAKEDVIRKRLEEKAQAQAFANALSTIAKFTLKKKTGDKEQIYGSVQASEISDAIYQQTGRDLSGAEFVVPEIKSTGTYECQVRLHPEVLATFSVVIVRDKSLTVKVTETKAAKK